MPKKIAHLVLIFVFSFLFCLSSAKNYAESPDDDTKKLYEVQALYQQGKIDESLKLVSALIERHPNLPDLYFIRASIYREMSDIEKVLAATPADVNAIKLKASICLDIGEYKTAVRECTKFLSLSNDDAGIYNVRGLAYFYQGEYKKAVSDFSKQINAGDGTAAVYRNRALAYYGMQKYEESLADFTSSIELDPSDVMTIKNRGAVYLQLKHPKEALADLNKALEFSTGESERAEIQALIQKVKGL